MSLAADRWPVRFETPPVTSRRRGGTLVVWRWETAKLAGQVRARAALALCAGAPFLVVAVLGLQAAVPADTLFGLWVHTSGLAVPLVVLGFAGQWVLPLLAAVVAGDIFSSEDHFGTWKTVLTRSRSRSELFSGKLLAALSWAVAAVVVLALASLAAGLAAGTAPLVGLSGQLIGAGHAAPLVLASWATQLAPTLAYVALAVLVSIATRNSALGMGAPVLLGLVLQLSTLVNMPQSVRAALLATPFASWHGFWVAQPFYGPLRQGLLTSAVWFVVCITAAWVFRRRSVGVW